MSIESSVRSSRPQSTRGFESEPADEWREDYGRGGPVRSNEPERDWFFEENANGTSTTKSSESPRASSGAKAAPVSYRGRGPKGYRPRDERIQELLCERLTEHPAIDASDLIIEVDDGIVRLRGMLPTEVMKQTLIQTIRGSFGVIGVLDEVQVNTRNPQ